MQQFNDVDLDPTCLAAITDVIGAQEVRGLLFDLLSSVERGLADMQEARRAGDWCAISRVAHRLAGGCGSLGALSLQQRLRAIEAAAKSGDRLACEGLLDGLPESAWRLKHAARDCLAASAMAD